MSEEMWKVNKKNEGVIPRIIGESNREYYLKCLNYLKTEVIDAISLVDRLEDLNYYIEHNNRKKRNWRLVVDWKGDK